MDRVAECIAMAMEDGFEDKIEKLRDMVEGICKKYPLYE
jgi:glycine/serine hydroxymethyltransferase